MTLSQSLPLIRVKLQYNNIDKNIVIKSFNSYDELLIHLYLKLAILYKPSDELSNLANLTNIPLFDIYTQNIVLVKRDELYHKIITFHYRPITNQTMQFIFKEKSVNFIKNFNLNIMEDSFYKLIYKVGQTTDEVTSCLRPSFLPVLRSTTPYYKKSELIYLALNMNIWTPDNTTVVDVCQRVSNNDINGKELLMHKIFIEENAGDNYIKYYSFLGSSKYNYYLRFPKENNRNMKLEHHISNFRSLLIKSPGWNKSYYVYRWIRSDEYLQHFKKGDIWIDHGFLSTTRQAFVSVDKNYFGYILIKIKVPGNNIAGSGLSVEFYSHFQEEQEIIFPPSNYKLISATNIAYYHPDESVSEKVNIKYEFEWISYITDDNYINTKLYNASTEILTLDFLTYDSTYYDLPHILQEFNQRYLVCFKTKIGNEDIIFTIDEIQRNDISNPYSAMFYTNSIDKATRQILAGSRELFLTWQNDNGDINLAIEISTIMSVNYYFKFSGMETKLIGNMTYDDIIVFIANLAKIFNSEKVVINSDYKKFTSIMQQYKSTDITMFATEIGSIVAKTNYHDYQLYLSDTNYFNQMLHHYINIISCRSDYANSFCTNLIDNQHITSDIEIIRYVLELSLNEFRINKKQMIIYESYIDLIFKLTDKLLNEEIVIKNDTTYDCVQRAVNNKKSIIVSDEKKLIDLYLYLIDAYNYLIPYFHAYIYNEYNINMDVLVQELNWKVMLNEPHHIYINPIKSIDIFIKNEFKLETIKKADKKYTLLD